jgi:hypothetical protein
MVDGSVGRVGASGNARGSRTEALRAGMRRGRDGDSIALNDAKLEGLIGKFLSHHIHALFENLHPLIHFFSTQFLVWND